MVPKEVNYVSKEDHLESERLAQNKHEYYQGEIFAVSGASLPHNVIFRNVFGSLFSAL